MPTVDELIKQYSANVDQTKVTPGSIDPNVYRKIAASGRPVPQSNVRPPGLGSVLLGLLPGGTLLDKKLRNDKITKGDIALEVVLSALPLGIGKIGRSAVTGAKAVKGLANVAKGTDKVGDVLKAARATDTAGDLGKMSRGFLRQSTIAPTSTLATPSAQRALIETTRKSSQLRGSAFRKFQNVEKVIGGKTDEVDKLLSGVKSTMPQGQFYGKVQNILDDIPDPAEQKRFFTEFNSIVNNTFGKKVPTNLSPTNINQLRRNVNSQLKGVFNKIKKGTQLSDKDEALLKLRTVFGESIDELAPKAIRGKVSGLNREISTLIEGIPEFKKAAENTIRPFGMQIPLVSSGGTRAVQATADIAGRTASNPLARALMGQAGVRIGADLTGIRQPRGTEENVADLYATDPTSPETLGVDPAQFGYPEDPTMSQGQLPFGESIPQQTQSQYPLEAALADIQRDPKHRTDYIAIYKMVADAEAEAGGGKLTAKQQEKVGTLSTAERQIDALEQIFLQAGGPQGRIGGSFATVKGKLTGGQQGAYEQVRKSAVAQIARALGEVGVLTDQDIQRALGAIPKFSDTPEEVQIKLQYIREILGGARDAVTSTGLESSPYNEYAPQEQDLTTALMGLGGY